MSEDQYKVSIAITVEAVSDGKRIIRYLRPGHELLGHSLEDMINLYTKKCIKEIEVSRK